MTTTDHLPAYAAVGRWVAGSRVVVVGAVSAEGPARLMACAPGHLISVGHSSWVLPGIEVRAGVPELPLRDGAADVVVCIESYATYAPAARRTIVAEASRILRPGGMFAAWVPRRPVADDDADFWALEDELGGVFASATMVAQIPWEGVSLAPVVEDARVPSVTLEEALLDTVPEASHYLAIAFRDHAPADLHERLRSHCLLVAVPPSAPAVAEPTGWAEPPLLVGPATEADAEPDAVDAEPEPIAPPPDTRADELEATLQSRDTDIRVLTTNVGALEQSLARASERAEARAREAEAVQKERRELSERCVALAQERDAMALQVEVATAERAGARQLSERVEAELDEARRRLAEQNTQFAERTAEASRAAGELTAVRERLTDQEAALERARTQAEELNRTAARQDEQSRMLAEVAADRDRLRQELTRRAEAIEALEERAWSAREDAQKERLDSVRLAADVERLREQSERAREAEQQGRGRVESLSAELRKVEVERADAKAMMHSRDEELARLRADAETLGSESADLDTLRSQLAERGRELGESRAQFEQARGRGAEAAQRVKRREEQLSAAGDQLQSLRVQADHNEARVGAVGAELEVRALEVEQLAASVANLQGQLEEQRQSSRKGDESSARLQRRLETATEELDLLRNRLRAKEQELADLVCARETHGVEVYKLRQELEAASTASERLEEVLSGDTPPGANTARAAEAGWPDGAVVETRRLRAQLIAQTRRHAEQLARIDDQHEAAPDDSELRKRASAAALEADVRAEEQEHLLTLLEAAEQKIWEMSDASDRNAARLAASLAQLEKHKEQIDETLDELEVTRKLLAAAQVRALEQERLAASERAKLVRAGIDPDGLPDAQPDTGFVELDAKELMVELHVTPATAEAGAPVSVVADRSGSTGSGAARMAARTDGPRVLVEAVEDEPWDDGQVDDGQVDESPAGGAKIPRLSLPQPPKIPDAAIRTAGPGPVDIGDKGAANTGSGSKK